MSSHGSKGIRRSRRSSSVPKGGAGRLSNKPVGDGGLLEDKYPTHYLPHVGRQVMQAGGVPIERMPDFARMDMEQKAMDIAAQAAEDRRAREEARAAYQVSPLVDQSMRQYDQDQARAYQRAMRERPEAELRPGPEQSGWEMIRDKLLGLDYGRPTPERRQFVEGLGNLIDAAHMASYAVPVTRPAAAMTDFAGQFQDIFDTMSPPERAQKGKGGSMAKLLGKLLPEGSGYVPREGFPKVVNLPGIGRVEPRPIEPIEDISRRFAGAAHDAPVVPLNPEFSERVAREYEGMQHAPTDPVVRRAFEALADETMQQYRAAKDLGLDIRFLKPGQADPYAASPSLGYEDIVNRGRLFVFPTEQGFGSTGGLNATNVLLKGAGQIGDKPNAVVNDAFRVIHDLYGHFGPGNPFFRAPGEERAYQLHRRMFSPEALPALASETRGQNSWVNFGPMAERNKAASGAETYYADQKTGIMPSWATEEPPPVGEDIESFIRSRRKDGGDIGRDDYDKGGIIGAAKKIISQYADPASKYISNWTWRPLEQVAKDINITDVPPHVQSFGQHMSNMAEKAQTEGLDPEDLIKAYMITRASIQREGRTPEKISSYGIPVRPTAESLIRPEGHMADFLSSPMGVRFLNEARKGEISQEPVDAAVAAMRPFGLSKTEPDAMDWSRRNLSGQAGLVSDLVSRALSGGSPPAEWRDFTKGVRGIGPAKAGFLGSLLGRGDLPTLDARQAILHTGLKNAEAQKLMSARSGKAGDEAVDRLAARQRALDLNLPESLDPFYQHLAHHSVWDAIGKEKTTHQDIIDVMSPRASGGRAHFQRGGSDLIRRAIEAAKKAVPYTERMFATHNIRPEQLKKSVEQGALPGPSIGISKPTSEALTQFGDISLVARPQLVEPSAETSVFGRDVWTPRYPATRQYDRGMFRADDPHAFEGEGFYSIPLRRPVPATTENVVAEMRSRPIIGGEYTSSKTSTPEPDLGYLTALLAPKFRTFEDIQAARGRLVPQGDVNQLAEQIDREHAALAHILGRDRPMDVATQDVEDQDYFGNMLLRAIQRRRAAPPGQGGRPFFSTLQSHYPSASPAQVERVARHVKNIADLPATYFEAKPMRPVNLREEFVGAIVPEPKKSELAPLLEQSGIRKIKTYDPLRGGPGTTMMEQFPEAAFASGGKIPRADDEQFFRRLALWTYAVAPLFAGPSIVRRNGYGGGGGARDEQHAPSVVDQALNIISKFNPVGTAEAGPFTDILRNIAEKYRPHYDPDAMIKGAPKANWISGVALSRPISDMSVKTKSHRAMLPDLRLDPQDVAGEALISGLGDRTPAGYVVTHLNDRKLRNPVDMRGGPSFAQDEAAQIENAYWGSNRSRAAALANKGVKAANAGYTPTFMYVNQSPQSQDFSHMMTEMVLGQLDKSKMDPGLVEKFDYIMRSLEPAPGLAPLVNFPGITSPRLRNWLMTSSEGGAGRAKMAKVMDKSMFLKDPGFADIGAARFATTDPKLMNIPSFSAGHMISRMDPEGLLIKSPKVPHPSYDTLIASPGGRPGYRGGFEYPLPPEVHYDDYLSGRPSMREGANAPLQTGIRSDLVDKPFAQKTMNLLRETPTVVATPKWVDMASEFQEIMRGLYGRR